MRLFLLIFCLPLLTLSQSVFDGVFFSSTSRSCNLQVSNHWVSPDHMLKLDSSLNFKKVRKINGFTNINIQRFFEKWTDKSLSPLAPNNLMYQSEKENLIGVCNSSSVCLSSPNPRLPTSEFYIKNAEVSNAEYREFVKYVIDSIALSILAEEQPDIYYLNGKNGNLNFKRLKGLWDNEDNKEALANLYYGEEDDRFYKRKQLDAREFNYVFLNPQGEKKVLNIYPDTLSWVKDWSSSWQEPMTQIYFWHPVYDNYPVVGVSYNQVKAYLHWLTKKGINELDKKNLAYEIGLPTPEEIEYTTSALYTKKAGNSNYDLYNLYRDLNYAFDLEVTRNPKLIMGKFNKHKFAPFDQHQISNHFLNPYSIHIGSIIDDGSLHAIIPTDVNYLPGYYSINSDIFHLGTNVSEYLEASYKNYHDFITMQVKTFQNSIYPSIQNLGNNLGEKIKKYSNEDRLVMGSNWMDEHYEVVFGAPLKAIYSKTFINPDSAYSTVGFRYVIRLKKDQIKPEPIQTRKVKTVNIFEELKKAGFELKIDSSNNNLKKMIFHHAAKEVEVKTPKPTEVLSGVYVAYHDASNFNHHYIRNHHSQLEKAIKSTGGNLEAFYSSISNQPSNLVVEYYLKAINEYTVELNQL